MAYGKTAEADFPPVLIVGREPNSSLAHEDRIGSYRLDRRGVMFYNMAYRLVGGSIEDGRRIWSECRRSEISPILFADVLPTCIPAGQVSKSGPRRDALAAVDGHIKRIFTKEIMHRVSLILLSGHERYPFNIASQAFANAAKDLGIPTHSIRFLCGNNIRAIELSLATSPRELLKSVVKMS